MMTNEKKKKNVPIYFLAKPLPGTGLEKLAGKEDPVELDSSLTL